MFPAGQRGIGASEQYRLHYDIREQNGLPGSAKECESDRSCQELSFPSSFSLKMAFSEFSTKYLVTKFGFDTAYIRERVRESLARVRTELGVVPVLAVLASFQRLALTQAWADSVADSPVPVTLHLDPLPDFLVHCGVRCASQRSVLQASLPVFDGVPVATLNLGETRLEVVEVGWIRL